MHKSKFLPVFGEIVSEALEMGQIGSSHLLILAQIGLRVRFRKHGGVFWHRLAFVSDLASTGVFFGTDWPSCPI